MPQPRDDDELDLDDELPQDDDELVTDPVGEGEEGEGEDPDEQAAAPPQPRRRAPARDFERELEDLRRENEQLRRQPQQTAPAPQPPQEETEDAFERRISDWEIADQLRARHQRTERRFQQQMALSQVQTADSVDRASFQGLAARDRYAARYANEVEQRHNDLLMGRLGAPQFVPREALLNVIIGERARQPSRQERRQEARRQDKLNRQNVRAPDNRGDAGGRAQPNRGSEQDQRARRLANVQI